MWQLVDKSNVSPVLKDKGRGEEVLGGVEKEDWSHLNRRRRRMREAKGAREVKWIERVQMARSSASAGGLA